MGRTLQQLMPHAAGSVADVASRACAAEPERRFENAGEFYEAWLAALRAG